MRRLALPVLAALLGGCVTIRSAQFPGKSYDQVFKATVAGMCTVSKSSGMFIVYKADPETGVINMVRRGFGHQKSELKVVSVANVPGFTITMPGINPVPDMIIGAVQAELASKTEGTPAPAPSSTTSLDSTHGATAKDAENERKAGAVKKKKVRRVVIEEEVDEPETPAAAGAAKPTTPATPTPEPAKR